MVNTFLPASLTRGLKQNIEDFYIADQFHPAGTGNISIDHSEQFRSDRILWLDRKNDNEHEAAFFILMDSFVAHLNSTCYTGINDYEFHYTVYPIGSSYKKHRDQFKLDDSRQFSMIMYLNDDWQKEDGGALHIFLPGKQLHILPEDGKCVFFKSSELEHEVLMTYKPRLSITGWLKRM
jgi:SM-20-related protein